MDEMLLQSDIRIYDNYDVVNWSVERQNTVSMIYAESEMNVIELPCSLFICFERELVKRSTILGSYRFNVSTIFRITPLCVVALRQVGIVFDGRLIVNSDCQTNDPHIYAAGPMTKYRAAMHADDRCHVYYNSNEIGTLLAIQTQCELDPFASEANAKAKKVVQSRGQRCKVIAGQVLNGYHFMHIGVAGKQFPIELARASKSYVHPPPVCVVLSGHWH